MIDANASTSSRTGALTVAGQTVTISQQGCAYTVNPTSASFGSLGGNGEVDVATSGGCPWTTTSNAPWITITDGTSETGNGKGKYQVAINTTLQTRTGTITIAGVTVTITQTGVVPEAVLTDRSEVRR
jgi:hypothetical protein